MVKYIFKTVKLEQFQICHVSEQYPDTFLVRFHLQEKVEGGRYILEILQLFPFELKQILNSTFYFNFLPQIK